MGRRTAPVVMERDNRDKGGVFMIEEMPAFQATEWFMKAMQFLARSGTDVPSNIFAAGAEGFAVMGIGAALAGLGRVPYHEARPLLDELLTCVKSYQPPGGMVPLTDWRLIKGQIEEVPTFLQLYEEVVSLHLGFSIQGRLSTFRTLVGTMISELTPNTRTSTEPSPSSSEADLPA
jgi:hypothetical protein